MNIGNNIGNIMKITGAWNTFKSNHPKFPAFCQAVSRKGLKEGSIIEIAITTPEGEKIETKLKVKDSDLELLKQLSDLKMCKSLQKYYLNNRYKSAIVFYVG